MENHYYASFPIQEQGLKGDWNYQLTAVYMVGVLDFIFDDHKHDETLLHTVQLKNQRCEVFYDKLTFIYIELPKFTKTLEELESHFDKWLYLFRHLPTLDDPPPPLQEAVFDKLFAAAELANFSRQEQESYQQSLKYYRDLNNVMDTARQEAREEGRVEGQRSLLLLLSRNLGTVPDEQQRQVNQLSIAQLEQLGEIFFRVQRSRCLGCLAHSHPRAVYTDRGGSLALSAWTRICTTSAKSPGDRHALIP